MIDFLDGMLIEKSPARIVLEVAGVGYEVFVSLNGYGALPAVGARCRVLTYDHIREDQHVLFGFVTPAERRLFGLLLNVSGIGPKIAMSALSGMSVTELAGAITGDDTARLSGISGIGRKTAERMVLELRDKMDDAAMPASTGVFSSADQGAHDAARALVSLGYKPSEAQKMVAAVMAGAPSDARVEDLVRLALRR